MQKPLNHPTPRTIFITGASSGLGAALARHYAKENTVIGLVGRNNHRLQHVNLALNVETACFVADVRDAAAMREVCNEFVLRFGTPDLVIANAGISHGTLTEFEEDIEVFKSIMETNVMGVVHTFQPFYNIMKERGSGCLAAISSVAGLRGLPGAGAYSASKAAVNSYMESLRVDLHGSGVKAISVCPGHIKTPMTDGNLFSMPFRMDVNAAAAKIAWHIEHSYGCAVTPWQMNLLSKFFKHIPYRLFDTYFSSVPTKKRIDQ